MILALVLAAALPADAAQDPIQAEAKRRQIASLCAISQDRLTVEKQDDPTYRLVVLKGDDPLSDRQLGCYMASLTDQLWPSIENDALSRRYDVLRRRESLRIARNDLRLRGLLGRVPRYEPRREQLEEFALRLEKLCGVKPRAALVVEGDWIKWAEFGDLQGTSKEFDAFRCARSAATVAGFDPTEVHIDTPMVPLVPPSSL